MSSHDPAWKDWVDAARAINIVDVASRLGAKLRRSGVDLVGPCGAGCASTDGFVVTPTKQIFLCRPSGDSGDAIAMVQHVMGCDFVTAVEFVAQEDRPAGARKENSEEREAREDRNRRRDAANAKRMEEQARADAKRRERDDEAIADIIARAVPISGTHAEAYLREGRGLRPSKRLTGDLRFVSDLDYWGAASDSDDGVRWLATLPAMVAIIRDVIGVMIGVHLTYLDPKAPAKWKPIGASTNNSKKIRGEHRGGLIRLGLIGESLAMGEGIETTLAWHSLAVGPEDISLAASVSLGNMRGKCTATLPHPTLIDPKTRKPTRIPNGIPDPKEAGVILPPDVRELILLGDGDSELISTQGAIATAVRRWMAEKRRVFVHFAPPGMDFNDVARAQ